MHQKVAEKNAQTHLTNVVVLVAHAFEEAEDAYKIAPTGSTLEVTARDTLTDLRAVVERISKQLSADYERHISGDDLNGAVE